MSKNEVIIQHIYETTDYNCFKIAKGNRCIDKRHVNGLIKSIKTKNLLREKPILVDLNMNVIDGQHRLEAARKMNIPVFYVKSKNVDISCISLLNSNSNNWKLSDYANYWIEQDGDQYLDYKILMTCCLQENLSIQSMGIICTNNKFNETDFKNGKFKIDVSNSYKDIMSLIEFYRKFLPFPITCKEVRGIVALFEIEGFDIERFKDKITKYSSKLVRKTTLKELVISLVELYNYKTMEKYMISIPKKFSK